MTINRKSHGGFAADFFARALHTRTAVARLSCISVVSCAGPYVLLNRTIQMDGWSCWKHSARRYQATSRSWIQKQPLPSLPLVFTPNLTTVTLCTTILLNRK